MLIIKLSHELVISHGQKIAILVGAELSWKTGQLKCPTTPPRAFCAQAV